MNWVEVLFELFDGIWEINKAKRDGASKKDIVLITVLIAVMFFIAIKK